MAYDRSSFDLLETYLHLTDGAEVHTMKGGPEFWATIQERTDLNGGRLVLLFHNDKDWDSWEMHPAGEEVVMLLGGSVDLVLDEPGGHRVVEMRGRSTCIVPRGIWHRAIVHEPGDTLHITRGAGTQNRPA